MEFTSLGRTGLRVSVAGLGCGGFSRLGQGTGRTTQESVAVVRAAHDAGVNFFDTARVYGTEAIVGEALAGLNRDAFVLSTKTLVTRDGAVLRADEVCSDLHASLRTLRVDCVDVFHLHAVPPSAYDDVVERIVPALMREQEAGNIRHLGITETAPQDPRHDMLSRAVHDGRFDVIMVAFHMLHQNARERVLSASRALGVGVLVMFAVRVLFSQPGRLAEVLSALAKEGRVDAELAKSDDPLEFLVHENGASDVIDAAYRYCRHEPGNDVVLFGTGNIAHIAPNVRSILGSPLPATDLNRLKALFGHLEGVGLDAPTGAKP